MERITRKVFGLVLMLMIFSSVGASNSELDWKFSGFGFWTGSWNKENGDNLSLRHVWLIAQKPLREDITVTMIFAPQGPPRLVHNFVAVWKNPVQGIDRLTVGRFIPPFTRESSSSRIDYLETINYSGLASSLVVRDDGIQVDGSVYSLKWSLAAFGADERICGFEDERRSGALHFYQRAVFDLPHNISIGAGSRLSRSDRRFLAAETSYQTERTVITAEVLDNTENIQWYLLGARKVAPWLRLVLRYEDLAEGHNFIPGLRFSFGNYCELKTNVEIPYDWSNSSPGRRVLSQLILRF